MKPGDFDFISKLVGDRSGLVLTKDKVYLLESRLMPLARKHGLKCQSALNIDPLTASNFDPPFFVVTEVVPVVHRRDPRCFV